MTFKKGDPRPPGAGRKKGSANKTGYDVKAALRLHSPELAAELVRLALHAKNEATRTLAIREAFDRLLGKPTIGIEGAIVHGISGELQRLLQQHDGETRSLPSRSLPVRSNGTLIEHDANDGSDGNNGSGELH
jgi:hypothetical protein